MLFEAFTGHSSYSYGFNNPVMFGDPSGLAPEKHKSSGRGQDVLLGDNSMAHLMEQIMQANGSAMTFSYKLPVFGSYWE